MSTFEEDPSAQRQIWTPATSSGATLKTVSLAVDNGPIGRGGSGAHYVTGADGGRWVMKATLFGGQAHRYLYLNEALSAQVAWRLGVRAPEIAIMELSSDQLKTFSSTASDSARFVLASHLIEPAEPLSPDTANSQTREARAGITVLDAIVWNTDRNPEHVLASRSRESEWDLWAIDHGHTFATADTIVGHLDPTAPMPGSQPLLASGSPALTSNHGSRLQKASDARSSTRWRPDYPPLGSLSRTHLMPLPTRSLRGSRKWLLLFLGHSLVPRLRR